MNQTITDLTKSAPVVGPDDTIRRAASLIRGIDGSSIIVILQGQILGTVSEKSIAALLSQSDDPEQALDTPVSAIIAPELTFVNFGVTIREAASLFAANDADMLPVIDNYGGYHGVLYRADVVAYLSRTMKMPSVGGMATPLGVYLTTGSQSGGANNIGLFLSGLTLGLCFILSGAMAYGIMRLYGLIMKFPIDFYLNSPAIGVPNVHDLPYYILVGLNILLFRTIFQLSPLAGYHAAEHMTVHAIEAGEILTLDTVRKMPRVHPRCGTNLLTGLFLFTLITKYVKDQYSLLMAGLIVALFWRSIGGWAQQYVTTKKPTQKQLASGIAAGNELIELYHKQPNYQVMGFARIWKMGLLQNAAGLITIGYVIEQLARYFHLSWMMRFLGN
ncbi:MAG: DUF1385 domain-containing protein [Armatimonadetes bacterium]|nr:DUF1385 domain-containing protein [Armatimonadota bacterium]